MLAPLLPLPILPHQTHWFPSMETTQRAGGALAPPTSPLQGPQPLSHRQPSQPLFLPCTHSSEHPVGC